MRSILRQNTASAATMFALSSLTAAMPAPPDGSRRAAISRATGRLSIGAYDGNLSPRFAHYLARAEEEHDFYVYRHAVHWPGDWREYHHLHMDGKSDSQPLSAGCGC